MNTHLHPCKVPPPKYDDICCKAPKTFIDKYCAEQKLWREINCPRKCKPKCCPKGDPWDVCSKYFGYPNYDCMEAKNFRENNKTMAALTNCMKRTCATKTCQGPYYSMTGPVYHPPGWKCQDYSLYIPTERILKHCKCKGNHSCLKKKKCNPFRSKMCSCPQGDCCCCCYPYDCLPCNFQCGSCSCPDNNNTSQDCCFNVNNGDNYYNNNNNNTNQQQGSPSYDGQTGNLNSPTTYDGNYQNTTSYASQSATASPSQPFMFDVKQDENGRNRIEGAIRIRNSDNNTNHHDPDCNCSLCNRRDDPMSSGNHYPDCQCELCQRRRNGNYICPKITDRKGERCKKLWFGNYKASECDQPPLSSTLAQLLNSLPDSDSIECTGRDDCPCARCCKQRAYARIKPHHWYSNGLENPDMKFKRPPQLILNNDENNNLTDEVSSSNNSSTRSPTNVKFSDTSDSSSSAHRDGNNNPHPPQQQQHRGEGPRSSKSEPLQRGGQINANYENNGENSPSLDDDDDNVEPLQPCKPENPCRKSFGLGVMPKFPCCCNKNNCNNNCCCCNSMGPEDWACCNPCEFQTMNNNCNNHINNNCYCPQTATCPPSCEKNGQGCEKFDSGSYGTNSPVRKLRRGNDNYFFPKSSTGDDGDNNNRGCPRVEDEQIWAQPNDYNTTTYRQFFKQCKSKPRCSRNRRYRGSRSTQSIENNSNECFDSVTYPHNEDDDDGWCCGKPRYRRGRKFNEDCQVYPTETNSFRIFADLDKRIAQCQRCEQDYEPIRTCHDRQCRMPLSYEIRENTEKKRRYCDEETQQICSQNCNMLDRYCNSCQD